MKVIVLGDHLQSLIAAMAIAHAKPYPHVVMMGRTGGDGGGGGVGCSNSPPHEPIVLHPSVVRTLSQRWGLAVHQWPDLRWCSLSRGPQQQVDGMSGGGSMSGGVGDGDGATSRRYPLLTHGSPNNPRGHEGCFKMVSYQLLYRQLCQYIQQHPRMRYDRYARVHVAGGAEGRYHVRTTTATTTTTNTNTTTAMTPDKIQFHVADWIVATDPATIRHLDVDMESVGPKTHYYTMYLKVSQLTCGLLVLS